MKVIKFGGELLSCKGGLHSLDTILKEQPAVIVVAALNGTTDSLLAAANKASIGDVEYKSIVSSIKAEHVKIASSVLSGEKLLSVNAVMIEYCEQIYHILQGVELIGELTLKTIDRILGYGELLSSILVSNYIGCDICRSLLVSDDNYGSAKIDVDSSVKNILSATENLDKTVVVPGFVAVTADGIPTTLGRGGSDYTAAIIASAVKTDKLVIFSDDLFMSADPEVINDAYLIDRLSYSEALEFSNYVSGVVSANAILVCKDAGIDIKISSTSIEKKEEVIISSEATVDKNRTVKGISSISNIVLITLQGFRVVGATSFSRRALYVLDRAGVEIILLSQSTSDNCISFAVREEQLDIASNVLNGEFAEDMTSGEIETICYDKDLSIVAVIGDNMKGVAGVAGKLFQTLGNNGISLTTISQSASEHNISFVVKREDLRKTLKVVHEIFFLSPYVEVNIFLVGVGLVGKDLLRQISQQQTLLLDNNRLKINVAGIANSSRMLLSRGGIDPSKAVDLLLSDGEEADLSSFVKGIDQLNMFNSIFVDCTAHAVVADCYTEVLSSHISIVAANKVAASSDYSSYLQLKNLAKKNGVKFLFETNVGAGLPLISTINDLVRSGDKILKIEAVLSGTLNFLFNELSEDVTFSRAINMAKEEGYSEPDPRIDLSGVDVLRKVVILARESGYVVNQSDVMTEPFIPTELFDGSMDRFWEELPKLDSEFEEKRKALKAKGQKWRYVGKFENGEGSCSLKVVGQDHPFYDLEGSNNIVLITTERYKDYPLQIKGYGAGAAVTAAGVFADIIKIANI